MSFLNILENYAALFFSFLASNRLQASLPEEAVIDPYPWQGLNHQDPLLQRHCMSSCSDSGLRDENTTLVYVFRTLKPRSNKDLLFRFANQSMGYKSEAPLIRAKCLSPNCQHIDRDPRYEISSGNFSCRLPFLCGCSPERRIFLPSDRSLPFENFQAANRQWDCPKAEVNH